MDGAVGCGLGWRCGCVEGDGGFADVGGCCGREEGGEEVEKDGEGKEGGGGEEDVSRGVGFYSGFALKGEGRR